METQNITLSIPKRVLSKFKELAFRRQQSISGLMTEMMEDVVQREEGYLAAKERFLHRLQLQGYDFGTQGKANWTRNELHER